MKKKNDVFGQKLKLTPTEKKQHRNWMNKAETISLYLIQLQIYSIGFYMILISLGISVFPKKQTRQKFFRFAIKLIHKFWWLTFTPIIYQLINNQSSTYAFSNSFLY